MTDLKTLQEEGDKEFTSKFGQFYLKAFNSGIFFHVSGTSDNQATIDFVANNENEPTTSEEIKKFIHQEREKAFLAGELSGIEKAENKIYEVEIAKDGSDYELAQLRFREKAINNINSLKS